MAILIILAVFAVLTIMAAMKVSGDCSRQEEKESTSHNGNAHKN